MQSDRALRACMQALVLLNLVFVQLTGAAALHWLVPLYVLAASAPFLERFRERIWYRALWNGGIVCFFFVLLRHAQRADLAYVLEDGLVLAVLCQVHLLNNLRSTQRPDLLFFNAFLIAIIAAFMSTGAAFPVAFVLFAPCFVVGLQILSATRGGRVLDPTTTRRLAWDGARRASLVLALSLLVFAFWPRDFERKAFFHGRIDFDSSSSGDLEIGFNQRLDLDRRGPVESSDREAMRATLLVGDPSDVSPLWRGATLGATNGGTWQAFGHSVWRDAGPADDTWRRRREELVRSEPQGPASVRLEVTRAAEPSGRLFAPLGTHALRLGPDDAELLLRAHIDGTLEGSETGALRYQLTLAPAGSQSLGGARRSDLPQELAPYVVLPANQRVARARELATELTAELPGDIEQHELVNRLRNHLARSFTYMAPGSDGAAVSLDEFLDGTAGGHCEFFASALATMLRSLDVPCRVATGFRSNRWDGQQLFFGMRDAHAWVEVHDPLAGWYSVDPTPSLAVHDVGSGLWARLSTSAREIWETVTGFDSQRRAALFASLRSFTRQAGEALAERPLAALALIPLLALVAALRRRRRAGTPPAVRAYRRALRRARIEPGPGETPRELLARARESEATPERLRLLEEATRTHEASRYAA